MSKKIRFVDAVNFEPMFQPEVKDFLQDPNRQLSSLRVKLAATHAGKITRNNGFYLPHKMREGAASFTAQYPKPIQTHHDSMKDPVGRVVAARYVDISGGIMDAWNTRKVADSKRPIKDELLIAFCDGKFSHRELVEIADKYFIQDENIIDDPDYQGLGYIELTADITDPDAIRKVLDKRYLTGSVGASTDSAVCSICKSDWANEDGPCEHRPGKVYDGKKCVLIAGSLEYDEWSFVNAPADTHSAVIELSDAGIHDSVQLEHSFIDKNENVQLEILDHIIEESQQDVAKKCPECGAKMEKKSGVNEYYCPECDEDDDEQEEEDTEEMEDSQQEEKSKEEIKMAEVTDEKQEEQPAQPTEEVKDEAVQPAEEPAPQETQADSPPAEPVQDEKQEVEQPISVPAEPDPLQHLREFYGPELEEIIGDDEWGRRYADMVFQAATSELKGEEDEDLSEIKDKKLSSKARKALSASTFCGPDRSYPVPDCSHAKVAMAYAKKYNESSSVISCIRRKASRLGCPFKSKSDSMDLIVEVGQYSLDYFDRFDDDELLQIHEGSRKAVKERDLICPCMLEPNKEEELQNRIDALQKEVKYLVEDTETLNVQLADLLKVNRDMKAQKVCDFAKLAGDNIKLADNIQECPTEELDKILNDLAGKVDIAKIADTINSGLSNNPQGTVENPVVITDAKASEQGTEVKVNRATLEQIRANYFMLSFQNQVKADQYLADLQARGVLPKGELKIEDKS
jgi:outer membrane biosynthesis protein TonB